MKAISIETITDQGRIYGVLSLLITLYASTVLYLMHCIGQIM